MMAAWRLYPWPSNRSYLYQSQAKYPQLRQLNSSTSGRRIGSTIQCYRTEHKEEPIQVSTLLTVIGASARQICAIFQFEPVEDQNKISAVLAKFEAYCLTRLNIPFERYKFYRRQQQAGESLDQYATVLRQQADWCDSHT